MNVRRKLFMTTALFILSMGLIFIFMTQFVIKGILDHRLIADRTKEIEKLSHFFTSYYNENRHSFEGVKGVYVDYNRLNIRQDASFMLVSSEMQTLYHQGDADEGTIKGLGVIQNLQVNGETVAYLYYHDIDVANISIVRMGIRSSVITILFLSTLVLVIIWLLAAYWFSKKLTFIPSLFLHMQLTVWQKGNMGCRHQ